jgi:hypothetical protein
MPLHLKYWARFSSDAVSELQSKTMSACCFQLVGREPWRPNVRPVRIVLGSPDATLPGGSGEVAVTFQCSAGRFKCRARVVNAVASKPLSVSARRRRQRLVSCKG